MWPMKYTLRWLTSKSLSLWWIYIVGTKQRAHNLFLNLWMLMKQYFLHLFLFLYLQFTMMEPKRTWWVWLEPSLSCMMVRMTLHFLCCVRLWLLNHHLKLSKIRLDKAQNVWDITLFPLLLFTQDNPYNIPVCVWLEETYPQSAPICYVRPTREMMVLRGKYISSNGEVMLPYLEEWKHVRIETLSCNLRQDWMQKKKETMTSE